jgi:hypothetical protein
LIYLEKWFGTIVGRLLLSDEQPWSDKRIIDDLVALSENEWLDFADVDSDRVITVCEDTVDFLGLEKPVSGAGKYRLRLYPSDKQKEIIRSYLKSYAAEDLPSLYFNAITYIQPRKTLRYENIGVEVCS